MIPVTPVAEPEDFDAHARKPGNAWLAEHPGVSRPRDFWSRFRVCLAEAFHDRCAYSAMCEPVGTVDHFQSFESAPHLAYEWTNYRYCSQWLNSAKKGRRVLDPFTIGEGWFEVLLPSLQLVLTSNVPADMRALAEETLRHLPIAQDERILRQRRRWYGFYLEGKLSLDGLREMAPLIAAAVERAAKIAAHGSTPP